MPTYNRRELLGPALASVLAQTFTGYEVIVIDDGSTDGTWEQLQMLESRLYRIRQENAGPGGARNLGAQHASGDYLAFLDSDDLWFPWTLATYAAVIKQQDPAFIAGKPFCFENENQLESVTSEFMVCDVFKDYLASGDKWRWYGVSSFVVRRNVFTGVGGFTNQSVNGEDADLALRLGTADGFVHITKPFSFGYREHGVSAMKDFSRTVAGCHMNVRKERADAYPGGSARATARRRILTRHVRPVTLECLRMGLHADAWQLYRETFSWHVRLGRWKYLLGFPMKAFLS